MFKGEYLANDETMQPIHYISGSRLSGGATLWQSSANALPVCCRALPVF